MTLRTSYCDPALLRHLTLPVLTRMNIFIYQTDDDRGYLVFNELMRRTPQLMQMGCPTFLQGWYSRYIMVVEW